MTESVLKPPFPVAAVLFDLDGTLFDTVPLIMASHRHTFRKILGWVPDDETIIATIGEPLRKTFSEYGGDKADAMLKEYTEWSLPRTPDMVRPFPGVPETLDVLRAEGFRLGVVTARRKSGMQALLDAFLLTDKFDVLVSVNDTERPKPFPDPIFHTMRLLGLSDPGRVLYVGDATHDMECARRAGTLSFAVRWTAADQEQLASLHPTSWLERMEDLPDLITLS